MKKTAWCLAVAVLASAVSMGAAALMTENQALVGGALEELGYEFQPSGVIGGPADYKISDRALNRLRGKTVTVRSDGSIRIK